MILSQTVNMAEFFYFNRAYQAQGPYNLQQLKELKAQGMIKPSTPMMTDTGYQGFAEQIPGLFDHVAEKSNVSHWINVIGILLIASVVGIGWKIILDVNKKTNVEIKRSNVFVNDTPFPVAPVPVVPATSRRTSATLSALLKQAESGDTRAMRELAMVYITGDGVAQNLEKSAQWLGKAAILGDAEAQFEMADILRTFGDPDEAFYWDKKSAEQDWPPSQYNLAICFRDGIGTSTNPAQSFFWYRKAADNGLVEAKLGLAVCYIHGIGTPTNLQRAVYWLQQASNDGNAEAKRRLGAAYIMGVGCPVDEETGLSLLREAASLGDEDAKELLRSNEVRTIIRNMEREW